MQRGVQIQVALRRSEKIPHFRCSAFLKSRASRRVRGISARCQRDRCTGLEALVDPAQQGRRVGRFGRLLRPRLSTLQPDEEKTIQMKIEKLRDELKKGFNKQFTYNKIKIISSEHVK